MQAPANTYHWHDASNWAFSYSVEKNLCFEAGPKCLTRTVLLLVLLQERVEKKLYGKENHIFFALYRE